MVKKRGVVWTYYNKKVDGTTVVAYCKFCNRSYIQNATRMEKHLARCEKALPEVKQLFLRVSTSKRVNRARLLGAKIGGNWIKQNGDVTLDISNLTEADLEDISEWNRQKEEVISDDVPEQSLDLIGEDEEQAWADQQQEAAAAAKLGVQSVNVTDKRNNSIAREWINKDVTSQEHISIDQYDETEDPHSQRISSKHSKTDIVDPLGRTSPQFGTSNHSALQIKILQEELLEKRAIRKLAELELRRKTVEFERYQYEYERDKTRADIRWSHESRMMQLREERERKSIQGTSHTNFTQ